MSSNWQPDGSWMYRLRTALEPAFDDASMDILTSDYFGPKNTFSKQASGSTWEFRLYKFINFARENDLLIELVAAARERRPRNQQLREISEELGLTATGPRLLNPTGRPLEELIRKNAKFIKVAEFLEQLAELERQVCFIDIPGGGGTGFLVGPDLVITNEHVIAPLKNNAARPEDVVCRFDYREVAVNNTSIDGVQVKLHGTQWLKHSKSPSQFDWDPTLGNAAAHETDCALIQLAERIGDVPPGGFSADDKAPDKRGWVAIPNQVPTLAAGNQIFLLQHPSGEPLQLTVGLVTEFNGTGTRVRYDANSKDGSSGSPCFDADLQLVALHHAHDAAYPPKWNQAVPFSTIKKNWSDEKVTL